MDFSLSQEQRMFRETVYRYGRDEIAPLCEEADLKGEFSVEIWRKLASFGILGLPFPEEFGGSAANILTCCLDGEALAHAGVDRAVQMVGALDHFEIWEPGRRESLVPAGATLEEMNI